MSYDICETLRGWSLLAPTSLEAAIMAQAADEIVRLRKVRKDLGAKVSHYANLLDDALGAPCEAIRHQQEVERLRDALREIIGIFQTPQKDVSLPMYEVARAALLGEGNDAP